MTTTHRLFPTGRATILGVVLLAGCHGDREDLVPGPLPLPCTAQHTDLIGVWDLSAPAPDQASRLSSCSDPSLDGTPAGIQSLIPCLSPLPCPLQIDFRVSSVEPQLDFVFYFQGEGRDGLDRLSGAADLATCAVGLTITQIDNPAHIRCRGVLDGATRAMGVICDAAGVEKSSGDDLLVDCRLEPPIAAQITITDEGPVTPE